MTPSHGTRARYNTPHSCRCGRCKEAARRYRKRRHLNLEQGKSRLVDAGPVKRHLIAAKLAGVSVKEIARAANVGPSVAQEAYHGQHARISAETAARILAVDIASIRANGWSLVDATGSIRRVRALSSLGWTGRDIATGLRISRPTVTRLLAGTFEVASGVRDAVTVGYRRMLTQAPPARTSRQRTDSAMTRRRAAEKGWVGPLAWEDIDNDEQPLELEPWEAGPVIDTIRDLEHQGLTRDGIAGRLGVKRRTVDRAITRATRKDQAA